MKCWGRGFDGRVGDGGTTNQLTPVAVAGLSGVTAITAADSHTCAALADGTARCWGQNINGQLGDGTTDMALTPVVVAGLIDVVSIGAGLGHTCATRTDGSVSCWGLNTFGQLGDGTTDTALTPVAVHLDPADAAVAVDTGDHHSCVVLDDGGLRCWGKNHRGQLGNGATSSSSAPVAVSGITNATQVSAGQAATCATLADGGGRCWGLNSSNLGDGTCDDRSAPVAILESRIPITPLQGVAHVSTGLTVGDSGNVSSSRHNCAVLTDGTARCWGSGTSAAGDTQVSGELPVANRPIVLSGS